VLVILLLLIISAVAGLGAGIAIRAWPQTDPARRATAAVEDKLLSQIHI
jgi:hypothetical protein